MMMSLAVVLTAFIMFTFVLFWHYFRPAPFLEGALRFPPGGHDYSCAFAASLLKLPVSENCLLKPYAYLNLGLGIVLISEVSAWR
jgi:hypothetical protein